MDGIPDPKESLEGTAFCVKDNDIFSKDSLFIKQAYRDFLAREADAEGVSYWSGLFTNGTQNRASMVKIFMGTGEFQAKAAPITRLYKAYFNRMPDHEGLWYWVDSFGYGATVADISQTFAQSPEFEAKYGNVTNDAFIDLVYQNVLGRAADAEGKAYWLGLLNAGKQTRGEIMTGFSESAEHVSTTTNHLNLVLAYEGLLRRNVSAADYTTGMARLNAGTPLSSIISELMASDEFKLRFIRLKVSAAATGLLNDTAQSYGSRCFQYINSTQFGDCGKTNAGLISTKQDGQLGRDADAATNDSTDGTLGLSYTKIDADGYSLPHNATTWSCVKDNVTGLIWEHKTANTGLHYVEAIYTNFTPEYNPLYLYGKQIDNTYFDATWFVNTVNTLSLCGATDWRLPNVDELQSLIVAETTASPNRDYFYESYYARPYWTAEANWQNGAATLDRVQTVRVTSLFSVKTETSFLRSERLAIRLVRGAPVNKTNRYEILGDGSEVLDKVTQLIWKRCSEGQNWSGNACTGSAKIDNLEDAFKIADTYANISQKAWRLPNIIELNSLVNLNTLSTTINTSIFPNMPTGVTLTGVNISYWSSTPYGGSPYGGGSTNAYTLSFEDGMINSNAFFFLARQYIRLVRDAK